MFIYIKLIINNFFYFYYFLINKKNINIIMKKIGF